MKPHSPTLPTHLDDATLLGELTRLATRERQLTAAVVLHLAEVERRALHLSAGCASLFVYCTERLKLSEAAAFKRCRVARLCGQLPEVSRWLADGRVHLSGLVVLAPHLTAENCSELLARAQGLSKRALERLVGDLAPKPAPAPSTRRLPRRRSRNSSSPRGESNAPPLALGPVAGKGPGPDRATTETLGADRWAVRFTADEATMACLEEVKALAGVRGDAELPTLMSRALELLRTELRRKRRAETKSTAKKSNKKRKAKKEKRGGRSEPIRRTRHVPAAVRRQVWQRDAGRCRYVAADGHRCTETVGLQLDHVHPYALGGPHTVENIRLLCGPHNRHRSHASRPPDGQPPLPGLMT